MSHEDEDAEFDADRYDTALRWAPPDPHDPYRKQREEIRKKQELQDCRISMIGVRPASKWMVADGSEQRDLFGSLWHPGEVAVLCAETGTGKSILATHIAETIARGSASEPFAPPLGQRVLYLDFGLTPAQLTRRYSCPSMFPGRPAVKYRFSGRFKRSGFEDVYDIPPIFNGNITRFFNHSVELAVGLTEAPVMIVDDLAGMSPSSTGISAAIRSLRGLKLTANATGMSILVIVQAKPKRRPGTQSSSGTKSDFPSPVSRPLSLADLDPQIAGLADSVFCIGRSNFAPDVRYIKHLKSTTSEIEFGPENVLTYRLERLAGPRAMVNGKRKMVNEESTVNGEPKLLNSSNDQSLTTNPSQLTTNHSPLSITPSPFTAHKPFLGFTFLGHGPESDHHRDYAAEALAAEHAHQKTLRQLWKRSTKQTLADAIVDGSYGRYLKGE